MAGKSSNKQQNGARPKQNGSSRRRRRNGNGNGAVMQGARVLQPVVAPLMSSTENYRPMNNRVHEMSGSDFLGPLTVKAVINSPSERILREFDVSPSAYPGTRLAVMSQLFERYRFTSFRVRYVPAVPNTVACQLLVYLDTDPLDEASTIVDADQLIRQATAHTGSQQWNFNSYKAISLPMRSDKQLYYTGLTRLNERFNLQARIVIIQVTTPVDFNGQPLVSDLESGSLYIDWTVRFETPQINPSAFTVASRPPFVQFSDGPGISGVLSVFGFSPGAQYLMAPFSSCDGTDVGCSVWRGGLITDGFGFPIDYAQDTNKLYYGTDTSAATGVLSRVGAISGPTFASMPRASQYVLPLVKCDANGTLVLVRDAQFTGTQGDLGIIFIPFSGFTFSSTASSVRMRTSQIGRHTSELRHDQISYAVFCLKKKM